MIVFPISERMDIASPTLTSILFPFRPWVRRAGLSIVMVAALATVVIILSLLLNREARFGWMGERFVWVYLATLWLGGLKVFTGTFRPVAEVSDDGLVLRPLHQFRERRLMWSGISGTEQMTGGDRLIVYFDSPRGMRFVAMNLNLIKGRRDFVQLLDRRLLAMDFREKVVERSRYLTKPTTVTLRET